MDKPHFLLWLPSVAAAIATIIIALVAIFQDRIRLFINRPKLRAELSLNPPDCHKIPLAMRKPALSDEDFIDTYYFRIRIHNDGNTPAENVEVFAASLIKVNDLGERELVDSFLPMNLTWSHIGGMYFKSILPEMYKHCDLGFIMHPDGNSNLPTEIRQTIATGNNTVFIFEQIVKPNNLGHIIGSGRYYLDLIIAAQNAKPRKITVNMYHLGHWFDDYYQMFTNGITMALEY